MEHPRVGQPPQRQAVHPGPGDSRRLAAGQERPPPEPCHPFPKHTEAVQVARDRMIVEVALHDRPEPLARLHKGSVRCARGVAA
jgi:hypothetical protein